MTLRTPFQTQIRAAAVDLLSDFAADVGLTLQVYRGRPATLHPPTAFVDRISETIDYTAQLRLRTPRAEVIILHGLFDSGDTVDQRDAFVDAFLDWVTDNVHAAGANTTISGISVEDDPTFTPDWVPLEARRSYFATLMTLEGYSASG